MISHFRRWRVAGWRAPRQLVAVIGLSLVCCGCTANNAWAQENSQAAQPDAKSSDDAPDDPPAPMEMPLPKIGDMKVPDVATLLQGKPVCWVVTIKDEVIVSEPVKPRPYTLDAMNKAIADWPKGKSLAERQDKRLEFERLHYLAIVLLDTKAEEPEYQLPMRFLKDVIHHEDLMLRRIDMLMDDSKFRTAFEMLLALERVAPPRRAGNKEVFWPGYVDRRNRLMLLEAETKIKKQRFESAIAYLDDLKSLMADPPTEAADDRYLEFRRNLDARFSKAAGDAIDPLIASAVTSADYRQARFFIQDRLESLVPGHPVAAKWRGQLQNKQQDLLKQSVAATGTGKHDQAAALATEAARYWPDDIKRGGALSVRATYAAATGRFQTLTVGVVNLSGSASGCPFPSESDRRHHDLLTQTLFHVDRFENIPYYRTNYFEQYEPTDLGRQVEFTLRPRPARWQAGPPLTSDPIVKMLTARIDPASPWYDERLAMFVGGLSIRSPHEFVVRFSRVPVSPEALLKVPVMAAAPSDQDGQRVLSRRFRMHDRGADYAVYRREVPEPDGLREYHVAEVRELRYDSYIKALQGLVRGEFEVLPRLPSWHVRTFEANERLRNQFFVVPYAVPTTHVVQFNPRSKALRNSELRRALAFAVDRPKILSETVLRDPRVLSDPDEARGRVVTAPFPRRSYAYSQQLDPRKSDAILAISLSSVAANRLGGQVPPLKMVCSTEPIARAAAMELVKAWKRVGIPVSLVEAPKGDKTSAPADWDLAYRTLHMTEPIVELWPFLTMQPAARVADLMYMPDWLRQELIDLDRAENFQAAVEVLHRLHRHIQEQVLMLPLWEVDEVMVIPRNIKGISLTPLSPYQGLEKWTIQSRVPQDNLPNPRKQ